MNEVARWNGKPPASDTASQDGNSSSTIEVPIDSALAWHPSKCKVCVFAECSQTLSHISLQSCSHTCNESCSQPCSRACEPVCGENTSSSLTDLFKTMRLCCRTVNISFNWLSIMRNFYIVIMSLYMCLAKKSHNIYSLVSIIWQKLAVWKFLYYSIMLPQFLPAWYMRALLSVSKQQCLQLAKAAFNH